MPRCAHRPHGLRRGHRRAGHRLEAVAEVRHGDQALPRGQGAAVAGPSAVRCALQDGDQFASCSYDRSVVLWDVSNGLEV